MFAETIFFNLPYLLLYQKITLIFVKVPKRVGREFFGTDKLFWSILYAFDAGILCEPKVKTLLADLFRNL